MPGDTKNEHVYTESIFLGTIFVWPLCDEWQALVLANLLLTESRKDPE